MRFCVHHETHYRYSRPVSLGPHLLRLNPRVEGTGVAATIAVEPVPVSRFDAVDGFGNRVTHLAFDGATDQLRIISAFELDSRAAERPNAPALPPLPWPRDAGDGHAAYRPDEADATVRAFAADIAAESGFAALAFLDHLNGALHHNIARHIRPEGAAQSAAETLALGRGACRDLAVLFIAACRSLGIAARFVSGYQAHSERADGRRYLHAWPEVFVPGLGWRGYDPTHGTIVADGHVALCAAPHQAGTMPIEGSFYGEGVTSTLDFHLRIVAE